MGDFKSFKASGDSAKGGSDATRGRSADGGEKQAVDLAAALAKAFAGKSEGQIFSTIIAQAEEGKKKGTLTNEDIDNFYNAVSPMLDGIKRRRLQQIVSRLKKI